MAEIVNAFTVDVEDYFQVSAFDPHVSRDQWADFPCRVVGNTHRILKLLDSYQVRGTFFVLGWVASRFPQLIKDICRGGHEVASHGFWHHLIYTQTPADFRNDLRLSRDTLEQIIGKGITAYRAPSFSITRNSLWALEILVEEGFTVDSSVFPIHHDRYGIPNAQTSIHELSTPAGSLCEAPPSVASIGGVRLPVGGGYFRLYPWRLSAACLRQINHRCRRPFIFYVHPWELDPEQPRLRVRKLRSRFRHYVNLGRTEARLHKLLQTFRLSTLQDVVATSAIQHPDHSAAEASAPLGANSNP
jgi:polysaccharide deacetylase family protein (PEP-CTERM system associated)